MPLSERDLKYLWDMPEAARAPQEVTLGLTRDSYVADLKSRLASERAIEMIGKAARRVSAVGRTQLPGVEWGAIVATRHILAHEYGDIDYDSLWRIITIHAPALLKILVPALKSNPPGPESTKDLAEP